MLGVVPDFACAVGTVHEVTELILGIQTHCCHSSMIMTKLSIPRFDA